MGEAWYSEPQGMEPRVARRPPAGLTGISSVWQPLSVSFSAMARFFSRAVVSSASFARSAAFSAFAASALAFLRSSAMASVSFSVSPALPSGRSVPRKSAPSVLTKRASTSSHDASIGPSSARSVSTKSSAPCSAASFFESVCSISETLASAFSVRLLTYSSTSFCTFFCHAVCCSRSGGPLPVPERRYWTDSKKGCSRAWLAESRCAGS
mmetsp:Transcript_59563/g.129158  ORF Transcript_59563/g.129158 Transcript_59563/m.129158 type:complete len:210 (+) Transcript_59563:698-1327(+)